MRNSKLLPLFLLAWVVACGSTAPTDPAVPLTEEPASGPLTLSSAAFEVEGDIPVRHGETPFNVSTDAGDFVCTGSEAQENVSPALSWENVPAAAASLALIMVDDMHFAYPDAPEGTFFPHWVVYNLPPSSTGLTEGQPADLTLPNEGGLQGLNGYPAPHDQGYGGPCPGPGEKHLYIFTLYALDTSLELPPGAQYDDVLDALEVHILSQAELKGYFTGL